MKYILLFIIKLYRLTFSRVFPPMCRYTPSCSEYATIALKRFGAVRGGYLSLRRFLRCHPYANGGADDVPDSFPSVFKRKNNSEK